MMANCAAESVFFVEGLTEVLILWAGGLKDTVAAMADSSHCE